MELIGKTKIDFMGMKKVTFVISGIIALIGLIAIIQIGRGAANMGIDFSGGIAMQLKFDKPVTIQQAREALVREGVKDAELQEITDGNKLLIKIRKGSQGDVKVADHIQDVLKKEFPANPFQVESSTEIGPSIGEKLKKDTLVAVAISMLGIVLYIAWRFDFKFGVAAVVATLHDVLAIFAVFFLLHKEVNLLLITAVLTIAGYSMTDTVVVFDRIRENLHKSLKDPLMDVFNRSINEVLSRTIVTSLTAFLSAVALLVFGGEVIHDFAFALAVGIAVGTYSSVFVASPIVVIWEKAPEEVKA
ncbi:protein translocase subunit SecF [Geomesophilobacter sediminis]|uniref:Protein-export membrane protein SecF n=1 Tax=Geomesophilobacter sediminis TaxID=2798584 RepID=A0A8J7JAU3_9BACT|nr:protein translocase subunit SecF [Geomesophilobacter sediminis]MBJ6723563.1 protein translocase subunit SecF [Geomesophilobacter sediminis]